MGDSEDDWFEKDIDEFVVQAPPSDIEHIVTSKTPDGDVSRIVYIDSGLSLIIEDILLNNVTFFSNFQIMVEVTIRMILIKHPTIKIRKI